MLAALAIRDVVLIDRLDLILDRGLNALTGETGAGKSILLDALGLALGSRSDAGLVRRGAAQASVSATFELASDDAVHAILGENDLAEGDLLILRRMVGSDGRSRAFINDRPVGLALLRGVAAQLVETHGQFETGALLDRETHRATLDGFGRLAKLAVEVESAWTTLRAARHALDAARTAEARGAEEESFLREALRHLDELAPVEGESVILEDRRRRLANRDRTREAVTGAMAELTGQRGAENAINNARRFLDRIADSAGDALAPAREGLDRAAVELGESAAALHRFAAGEDADGDSLEAVDDRLFTLRAAARRHAVEMPALSQLHDEMRTRVAALESGGSEVARLARLAEAAREGFQAVADRLSRERNKAAMDFDKAVAAELPPLKLDKARLVTKLESLDEAEWGPAGRDRVTFLVATNPGAEPGPISKVASGGELSRFMLAVKVVLAGVSAVPVMVFDEVDSGIGGATADAVGERLKRLGEAVQLLVVTHSPQVAARADRHLRVEKKTVKDDVSTTVSLLDEAGRREEIARMLSGATVTDEARAAAARLLDVA